MGASESAQQSYAAWENHKNDTTWCYECKTMSQTSEILPSRTRVLFHGRCEWCGALSKLFEWQRGTEIRQIYH